MDKEVLTAIAIGIGLSASCGFRVSIPMLVASIAAKAGIFPVNEGFQWLAGWPAILCFSAATVAEILAYYIPVVDNLLDTITTPFAVIAGTLLLTSVLPIDNGLLKWITGILFGGGAAAVVQGGSVLTRLASTKLTGGTGNSVVATGEHAAAAGTSVLSLFIPFFVAALVIVLVFFIISKVGKRLFARKQA
jgi:hypothetical protein